MKPNNLPSEQPDDVTTGIIRTPMPVGVQPLQHQASAVPVVISTEVQPIHHQASAVPALMSEEAQPLLHRTLLDDAVPRVYVNSPLAVEDAGNVKGPDGIRLFEAEAIQRIIPFPPLLELIEKKRVEKNGNGNIVSLNLEGLNPRDLNLLDRFPALQVLHLGKITFGKSERALIKQILEARQGFQIFLDGLESNSQF